MHLYQILILLVGACINSGILSLLFFSSDRTTDVNNHFLKALSVPLIFIVSTYVWHTNEVLASTALIILFTSPLLWPYNHYATIFGWKPFKLRFLVVALVIALISGWTLTQVFLKTPNAFSAISFSALILHLGLLWSNLIKVFKQNFLTRNTNLIDLFSICYELLVYSSLLYFITLPYENWIGNLFLALLIVLLLLIGISIVKEIRDFNAIKLIKRKDQRLFKEENLLRIKTNLELENKLSMFSGKATMVQLNTLFILDSFQTAQDSLRSEPKQSAKILTKLSKHLRNIVQFNFPDTQDLKLELKVLSDFINAANSSSENEIIIEQEESIDTTQNVPSRLLVSFVNTLYSNFKDSQKEFSLNISISADKEHIKVLATPVFTDSNLDYKTSLKLSRLNNFMFINRKKVSEIKFNPEQIELTILLNQLS